jgi:stage II sporulation protein M
LFPGSRLSSYLPEPAIRPYLAVAAGLYVAAFLGGVYAPPSLRKELVDVFMAATEPYINQSGGVLFLFILANNLIASILMLVLGVVFGIVPFIGILSNGLVLGVLWRHSAEAVARGSD